MRYVIAMLFAVVGAGLAAVFISPHVTTWVLSHMTFESPDDAATMDMLAYMGSNVAGLIVGWLAGWTIAGLGSSSGQKT